jgi:hypothetical protein
MDALSRRRHGLLFWDLHRFPWLFHWSVTDIGVPPTGAATVDPFGRLHAKGSGAVAVRVVPRFGRGFGVARFIITPPGVDPPEPPPSNADRCSRADTLVYRCRLGSPIGDARMALRRVGQRFTTLVITTADDSTLQSIALPGDMQMPSPDPDDVVRAFDADADGHPDLIVHTGSTRDGDPVYRLWRFDPVRKRFAPDTAFGARVAVSPVPARPCVQIFVHREAGIDTPFLCLKDGRWVEDQ